MNRPTASPILGRPENPITGEDKKGRASDSYKKAFWQNMRSKSVSHEVFNALQIGTDSEGGFLVPDEYERTLVDTLAGREHLPQAGARHLARNPAIARSRWSRPKARPAGSTRKRRIPESDDSFRAGFHRRTQAGDHDQGISEELMNDCSVRHALLHRHASLPAALGAAEEEAFFTGDGYRQAAAASSNGDRRRGRPA